MPVRTKTLGAGSTPFQVGEVSVYTCPAGKTAIFKSWALTANGSMPYRVSLKRSGQNIVVLSSGTQGANLGVGDSGWWVLSPGDEILIYRGNNTLLQTYWLSGSELLGVSS